MKSIVEKVLSSGLIDEATARMLEHHRMIPEGASALASDDKLKNATKDELKKITEDLATELEKVHKIRETSFDLERIRWPVTVDIISGDELRVGSQVAGVRDRFGRIYFHIDDVTEAMLTLGYRLRRFVQDSHTPGCVVSEYKTILEVTKLFIGETPACWQVTAVAVNG